MNYSDLLRKTHRNREARKLLSRARQIAAKDSASNSAQYTVSFRDLRRN
jgi:hypothetical protein